MTDETEKARNYLKDKCHVAYSRYIDRELAGDFACELKNIMEKIYNEAFDEGLSSHGK